VAEEARRDAELVALARAGNKRAFDRLVTRHQRTAHAVAIGIVTDADLARELVQEAMLQAYLSLEHLRDDSRFRGWLHGIVLNVCRSYLRDRKRDRLSLDADSGGRRLEAEFCSDGGADPQRLAEERELHRRVLEAVNALSPKDRAATLLFYYEQRSLREVAAISGASVAAVKNRLQRARGSLRKQLLPVYPELEQAASADRKGSVMVKATIDGVYEAPRGQFVTVVDEAISRMVHIWIGAAEALHISLALLNKTTDRPLTYDLIATLLQTTGARLEEVRIEALRENTFYAVIKLRIGKKLREIDSRPSDALALALRTGAPIYVTEEVLEQAGEDAEWIRHRRAPDYDESAGFRFEETGDLSGRLTERARNVLRFAQDEARRLGESEVGTEHLLLGLLQERDGRGAALLDRLKIAEEAIRPEIEREPKPYQIRAKSVGEAAAGKDLVPEIPEGEDLPYTSLAKRALDLAWAEAEAMSRAGIGTDHLLLGIMREAHGRGGLVLRKLGADLERAREALGEVTVEE
jgi:RNA polymerase sigma factor (sigma-70 family)